MDQIGEELDLRNSREGKLMDISKNCAGIQLTSVKTGAPFQVLASTGPLIILPASYMNEVRNDDRMTFGGFLKKVRFTSSNEQRTLMNQDFFTTYPGFQGFRPAVDNNVFTTSVRIGLTQALGKNTHSRICHGRRSITFS